jgi:hypothetical protein
LLLQTHTTRRDIMSRIKTHVAAGDTLPPLADVGLPDLDFDPGSICVARACAGRGGPISVRSPLRVRAGSSRAYQGLRAKPGEKKAST